MSEEEQFDLDTLPVVGESSGRTYPGAKPVEEDGEEVTDEELAAQSMEFETNPVLRKAEKIFEEMPRDEVLKSADPDTKRIMYEINKEKLTGKK